VPNAIGFVDDEEWEEHFNDHKDEFGATTKEEYLAMAKAFLEADRSRYRNIRQCTRRNGDIVRFNPDTNEFAVVTITGTIRTYFKPIPSHKAPPGTPLRKMHPQRSNMIYFRVECRR
jgi:pyocin large subunit-like protein